MFDINNNSAVSRIQSSFLSRNKLPNIILSQKFNMTKGAHKLSTDQEKKLLSEFLIDDFICFDKAVEINSLLESQVPSDLDFIPCSDEIHPLTVIVADSTGQTNSFNSVNIMPTVDLMGENGKQKLARLFRNANINE